MSDNLNYRSTVAILRFSDITMYRLFHVVNTRNHSGNLLDSVKMFVRDLALTLNLYPFKYD